MTATRELVLDASLTLAWALPDEASNYTDAILRLVATGKAWVPDLWPHEIANGLVMAQRRSRITAAQRALFIEELLKLPIEVARTATRVVLETQAALADRYSLTAYDAAYLDLALRKGLSLATQDKCPVGRRHQGRRRHCQGALIVQTRRRRRADTPWYSTIRNFGSAHVVIGPARSMRWKGN